VAAVVLLMAGLVTTSVVTAFGPPDNTDSAIEPPSYSGASYDPPTPSTGESSQATVSETPSTSPTTSSPTPRPTESQVSRSGDRVSRAPSPSATPVSETATPDREPSPTEVPTSTEPAPDAPQTTATTRSTNASRWVIGVGSDTEATYECSLDGGAYQPCGSTVTYDDLEKGTHEFAARATDDAGSTDPSPATLTAEIGPPGQG
jgi:cytoskeletal protein RodZ